MGASTQARISAAGFTRDTRRVCAPAGSKVHTPLSLDPPGFRPTGWGTSYCPAGIGGG